jgi:hypothetical protein
MPAVDPAVADRARTLHFGTLVIDGPQAAPMTPEHFARLRTAGIRIRR